MTLGPRYALDYTLQDTQVTMTVDCTMRRQVDINDISGIYLSWDGGGALLQLWCPSED